MHRKFKAKLQTSFTLIGQFPRFSGGVIFNEKVQLYKVRSVFIMRQEITISFWQNIYLETMEIMYLRETQNRLNSSAGVKN